MRVRDPPNSGALPIATLVPLCRLLDHDNHEMREKFLDFLTDPLFIPRYDISLEDERELALKRLKVEEKTAFSSPNPLTE